MRHLLINLLTLLVFFQALLTASTERPNILFILADDLGYGDLSVHGCAQYRTPQIDSIFTNGVRFTAGYVSNSVCAPSRAGLITGRSGSQFGFEANLPPESMQSDSTIGLNPSEKTIADVLQPLGYRSYCIGKWHLGYNSRLFHPNKRGFDEFLGFIGGSRSYFEIEHDPFHSLQHNGIFQQETEGLYMTDYLTDRAIDFIKHHQAVRPEQPFFMYMSYSAPHAPMHAKAADLERVMHIENEKRRTYAAMVLSLDDNVGRLLATLDELGITEETLLVFLSDNGGPISQNGSYNGTLKGKKGEVWEGGIRVPYAIQWKGVIPPGQVISQPVSSLDLLPTFAASAGVGDLASLNSDGVNLLPHLTGSLPEIPKRAFYWRRASKKQNALRYRSYKYFYLRDIDKEFLFNIEVDINEEQNLAEEKPELLGSMRDQFIHWEGLVQEPSFSSGWKPGH